MRSIYVNPQLLVTIYSVYEAKNYKNIFLTMKTVVQRAAAGGIKVEFVSGTKCTVQFASK